MVLKRHRMVQNGTKNTFCVVLCVYYHSVSVPFYWHKFNNLDSFCARFCAILCLFKTIFDVFFLKFFEPFEQFCAIFGLFIFILCHFVPLCAFIIVLCIFIDPFCALLCHFVYRMAQNDTERHRTAQNECKLKKLMSIKRHRTIIKAQNGTEWHWIKMKRPKIAQNCSKGETKR